MTIESRRGKERSRRARTHADEHERDRAEAVSLGALVGEHCRDRDEDDVGAEHSAGRNEPERAAADPLDEGGADDSEAEVEDGEPCEMQ